MAEQRLHSALAPIDLITREEMQEVLHKGLDAAVRARYIGVDSARIPNIWAEGTGGTINMGSLATGDPVLGPAAGDVWMLRRVNVTSSAFTTDQARYLLFRGTTPSDPNAYTNRQLLDGISSIPAVTYTTMSTPAVPASTVAVQNTTNVAQTVVITGGVVTAVVVNGITVGASDGTYVVPPYGSISVTYSSAPTWTWTQTQANISFTLGQQVGVAYNPGNKAVLLQPGEQIYAQVYNSVSGNTYLLNGEAIRVPAEMKGKVL